MESKDITGEKRQTAINTDEKLAEAAPTNDDVIKPHLEEELLAKMVFKPSMIGAITIAEYTKRLYGLDLVPLAQELEKQVSEVKKGNLENGEEVLIAQLHTLNMIFNKLIISASNNKNPKHIDTEMRLALKAQNQCRVTLETLANIKNPRAVAFVQQANIGYNQQVNNSNPLPKHEESEI